MMFYKDLASRPVFESAEEMLRWAGLDGLTRRTLQEELAEAGLSSLLISELVTVSIGRTSKGEKGEEIILYKNIVFPQEQSDHMGALHSSHLSSN